MFYFPHLLETSGNATATLLFPHLLIQLILFDRGLLDSTLQLPI